MLQKQHKTSAPNWFHKESGAPVTPPVTGVTKNPEAKHNWMKTLLRRRKMQIERNV